MELRTLAANDVGTCNPTLVVVLGMHRSGTSVATRLMETMGASFGDNLWPPGPDNPKGFFEDGDVVRLNIELMDAAGVDWQALPSPDFSRIDNEQLDHFEKRALALLQEKCADGMFALKDPRIGRLLPFWQRVFDRFDARMLYVIPFRHPLSVADSLAKRNKIPRGKSHMLWLAHVVPVLRFTEARSRAFLDYDRLMEAPGDELRKLAQTLRLTLDPERQQIFEQEYLEEDLRHSTFGIDDLEQDEAAPTAMKALFRAIVAVAQQATPATLADCSRALAQAETLLREVAPMLEYGWELELDIRKLYETLDTMHKRAVMLDRMVSEVSAQETQLRGALADVNDRCAAMAQEHTRRLAMLNVNLEESHAAIRELQARVARCDEELGRRDRDLAAISDQLSERDQELATREAEIANLLVSTSWRITAPLRFARRCLGR
jgi:hypothetical protein